MKNLITCILLLVSVSCADAQLNKRVVPAPDLAFRDSVTNNIRPNITTLFTYVLAHRDSILAHRSRFTWILDTLTNHAQILANALVRADTSTSVITTESEVLNRLSFYISKSDTSTGRVETETEIIARLVAYVSKSDTGTGMIETETEALTRLVAYLAKSDTATGSIETATEIMARLTAYLAKSDTTTGAIETATEVLARLTAYLAKSDTATGAIETATEVLARLTAYLAKSDTAGSSVVTETEMNAGLALKANQQGLADTAGNLRTDLQRKSAAADTAGNLRTDLSRKSEDQFAGAKNTTDRIKRSGITEYIGDANAGDDPGADFIETGESDTTRLRKNTGGTGLMNDGHRMIREGDYGIDNAGVDPTVIAARDWVSPAEVELDSNSNRLDWSDGDRFFLNMTNSEQFVMDNVGARKSVLLRVNTNYNTVTLPDYVELIRDDRTPPIDGRAPAHLYELFYINGRTYAEVVSVLPDSIYVEPPDPVIDTVGPIWTPDDLSFGTRRASTALDVEFTFPSSYPPGDAVASLKALVSTLPISTDPDYADGPPSGEERYTTIVDTFSVVVASGEVSSPVTLNRSMDSSKVWIEFEAVPSDSATTAAQSSFSFRWTGVNQLTFDRLTSGKAITIKGKYICDSTYQSVRRLYVNRSTSVKEQGYAISPGVAALVNSFARLHSQATATGTNTSMMGAIKFQSTDVAVIATYTFPASAVPATIQIVENPNMSVQHLTVPMSFLSQTTVVTTAHDIASTLYLLTARTSSSSPRYHNVFVVPPTDNLLLTIKRGGTFASGDSVTAYLMAVTFTDGSSNQMQTLSYATSDLTLSPALVATVDRLRTLTTSTGGWSHSSGWVTSSASTATLRGATTFNMSNNGTSATVTRAKSGVTATTYLQNFTFNATTGGGAPPDSVTPGNTTTHTIPLTGITLPNGKRQFTIPNLTVGTRYYVRLEAIDLAGNVTYSRLISDTTSSPISFDPTGNINRVWAIDGGERVKRTSVNHTLSTSANNAVWDNTAKEINLFGAKNEFVSFQLMLEADNNGATGVNVVFDGLTTGGGTIANVDWNGVQYNYVGKRIEMFVMHYMNIDVRTREDFVWWPSGRPGGNTGGADVTWDNREFLGWHGEQLVPIEAAAGDKANGQGGAPFKILPNQLQSVWVDIYIPKDEPAGNYTGTIYVTQDGSSQYAIPVNLEVYDFALSDTASVPYTGYVNEATIIKHHATGGSHLNWTDSWYTVFRKYQQLAKRHRMNLQVEDAPRTTFWQKQKASITGTLFTADSGYAGPGEGLGPELFHLGVYSQPNKSTRNDKGYKSNFGDSERPLSYVDANAAAWRTFWQNASEAWEDSFGVHSPFTRLEKYGPEEASIESGCGVADTSVFYDMRRKIDWLNDSSSIPYSFSMNFRPQSRQMILASGGGTFYLSPGQAGYIGNPCPYNPYPNGLVIDSVTNWVNAGIRLGMYSGTRPSFGTLMIDAPATDQQINPWIMWKLGFTGGYRLWKTGHEGFSGPNSTIPYNSWYKDYRDTGGETWGDGTFIYAGLAAAPFQADSRGLDGPIAGVRMKNWRIGAQAHLALTLAEQVGVNADTITNIVNYVVASCGNQYSQAQPNVGWKQHGWQIQLALRRLYNAIDAVVNP